MNWSGEGVIVSVRKYGENSVIIDVFTPDHGRHAGVVRGGASRKMAATLQPGVTSAIGVASSTRRTFGQLSS